MEIQRTVIGNGLLGGVLVVVRTGTAAPCS